MAMNNHEPAGYSHLPQRFKDIVIPIHEITIEASKLYDEGHLTNTHKKHILRLIHLIGLTSRLPCDKSLNMEELRYSIGVEHNTLESNSSGTNSNTLSNDTNNESSIGGGRKNKAKKTRKARKTRRHH